MTMPGDHIAADAADHSRLRAWRAEREQVIEVLKTAFVQDRLTKDEFDTRVGQLLTSQTCAELTEVTADLPAGPMGARPPRQVARTRQRINRYSQRTLTLSEWIDAVDTYYAGNAAKLQPDRSASYAVVGGDMRLAVLRHADSSGYGLSVMDLGENASDEEAALVDAWLRQVTAGGSTVNLADWLNTLAEGQVRPVPAKPGVADLALVTEDDATPRGNPSMELIKQAVAQLTLHNEGNGFLIIQREDEFYAQAARNGVNDYQVEYRDGDATKHFVAYHVTLTEAQAALCGWVFDLPGWRDRLHWTRESF